MAKQRITIRALIRALLYYPMDMEIDEFSARDIIGTIETIYIQNDKETMDAILHPEFEDDSDDGIEF